MDPHTPTSAMSQRQEKYSREVYRIQELMQQQDHTYEEQMLALKEKLASIQQKEALVNARIAELKGKESDQSEIVFKKLEAENKKLKEESAKTAIRNKDLTMIIDEYSSSLMKLRSQYHKEEQNMGEQKKIFCVERDMALQQVESMEAEFNNIHQKYERCKSVIEHFRINERKLAELSHDSSKGLQLINLLYQNLKAHATERLEFALTDLKTMMKSNKTDLAKLQAILQRLELECNSQEKMILHKSNELKEFVKMHEELLDKYPK